MEKKEREKVEMTDKIAIKLNNKKVLPGVRSELNAT